MSSTWQSLKLAGDPDLPVLDAHLQCKQELRDGEFLAHATAEYAIELSPKVGYALQGKLLSL